MVKICPVCKKTFSGKSSLAQHTASAHVRVVKSAPKMRSRRNRARNPTGQSSSSSGKDVMYSIPIKSGVTAGTVLYIRTLSPQSLVGTRLAAECSLWSRWKPVSLKITVVGAGASTTYGSVMLGWVADPTYLVRKGLSAVNTVGAMRPHITVRLNASGSISLPMTMSRNWYQTDGDEEVAAHGTLVLVAGSSVGGWTGDLSVMLELDWKVMFDGVEIPQRIAPENQVIHPDSGWYNLFTTSDGSWDSGRLTFKMHAGGSMASFSSAIAGVVYKPHNSTNVPYVKEDGQSTVCRFFSLIVQYGTPGLVLHSSYSEAVEYQKSGDPIHVLPYKSLSSVLVTPAVPQFIQTTSDKLSTDEDDLNTVIVPDVGLESRMARLETKFDEMLNIFRARHLTDYSPGSGHSSYIEIDPDGTV